MVDLHPAQRDEHDYYLLPLDDDLKDSVTLLRVDAGDDGRVLIHLHRGVNRSAFSMRFGGATEPRWEAVTDPRLTLVAPVPGAHGLSEPETVLAEVGLLLGEVTPGDGGIHRWGFEGLLPNDRWVLHLTQLAGLHERLEPARRSGVADDPRVASRMEQIVGSAESHATALGEWLVRAREIADEVAAVAQAQAHERRVQAVLDLLAGQATEDSRARPNPELPRITAAPS